MRVGSLGAVAAVAAIAAWGSPQAAHADLMFTLADCNSGLGCGTGNDFGTVTLHQVATDVVSVEVDLAPGVTWAKTALAGFEFNLSSSITNPQLSGVSPLWIPQSGAPLTGLNGDGMGSFPYQ